MLLVRLVSALRSSPHVRHDRAVCRLPATAEPHGRPGGTGAGARRRRKRPHLLEAAPASKLRALRARQGAIPGAYYARGSRYVIALIGGLRLHELSVPLRESVLL